jgi:hypothetical protein
MRNSTQISPEEHARLNKARAQRADVFGGESSPPARLSLRSANPHPGSLTHRRMSARVPILHCMGADAVRGCGFADDSHGPTGVWRAVGFPVDKFETHTHKFAGIGSKSDGMSLHVARVTKPPPAAPQLMESPQPYWAVCRYP